MTGFAEFIRPLPSPTSPTKLTKDLRQVSSLYYPTKNELLGVHQARGTDGLRWLAKSTFIHKFLLSERAKSKHATHEISNTSLLKYVPRDRYSQETLSRMQGYWTMRPKTRQTPRQIELINRIIQVPTPRIKLLWCSLFMLKCELSGSEVGILGSLFRPIGRAFPLPSLSCADETSVKRRSRYTSDGTCHRWY